MMTENLNNLVEASITDNFELAVETCLSKMYLEQPSLALPGKIMQEIYKRQRRNSSIKFTIWGVLGVISTVFLLFVFQNQSSFIFNSEAGKLFSLLFSDTGLVLSMWKDYLLSLVQALPVVPLVAVLSLLCLALLSISLAVRAYLSFMHSTDNNLHLVHN